MIFVLLYDVSMSVVFWVIFDYNMINGCLNFNFRCFGNLLCNIVCNLLEGNIKISTRKLKAFKYSRVYITKHFPSLIIIILFNNIQKYRNS